MIRCHITDHATPELIRRSIARGVEWIQIREKHLEAGALYALTADAVRAASGSGTRILVNGRMDVALAAGAQGVHLPGGSPPPRALRPAAPEGFLIGVSCHGQGELQQAEEEGADYAFLSPIFAPLSKPGYQAGLGLAVLRQAVDSVTIPILALGGITQENSGKCIEAGASGIAAITFFQSETL